MGAACPRRLLVQDDAMPVPDGPGFIKTAADAEPRPLTPAEAEAVFAAMAARADQIAFGYVKAGCESRAQVMFEHLETMGVNAGRATILTGGKQLAVADPLNPGRFLQWNNHTAPFVAVGGHPDGLLVIDPSLSEAGPVTITEWAGVMRARVLHVSDVPLSVSRMGELQTTAGIQGRPIDAFVFLLERGIAPVPERGGSGFRLAADPSNGVSAFAHEQMRHYLKLQTQLRRGRPWPE
jgi:hypothetical protein